jgi:hypothetical protein
LTLTKAGYLNTCGNANMPDNSMMPYFEGGQANEDKRMNG